MNPILCILGGCNGAGKTTLARELLLRLGLMRQGLVRTRCAGSD